MSPNEILVRNLVGVVVSIAVVTVAGLWLGRENRRAVASTYLPPPVTRTATGLGARLYRTKGCVQCHSIDGSPRIGPSFAGSWGTTISLADGTSVAFDEAYVRESLLRPYTKARTGFSSAMQSYDGLLQEREIDALVAYIRSLQ